MVPRSWRLFTCSCLLVAGATTFQLTPSSQALFGFVYPLLTAFVFEQASQLSFRCTINFSFSFVPQKYSLHHQIFILRNIDRYVSATRIRRRFPSSVSRHISSSSHPCCNGTISRSDDLGCHCSRPLARLTVARWRTPDIQPHLLSPGALAASLDVSRHLQLYHEPHHSTQKKTRPSQP